MRTLISPTTDATDVSGMRIERGQLPTTIYADSLGSGETVDVQIKIGDGTFVDVYQNDAQVQITSTNNAITIYGPGIYGFSKSSTASAVGLYVESVTGG